MSTNFQIEVKGNLHIIPRGDLDGNSAWAQGRFARRIFAAWIVNQNNAYGGSV